MIELCVVVEGRTEEGFVRGVLTPHLREHHVEPIASVVGSSGHKGGMRSFQRVEKHLRKWMNDCRSTLRFTTMIDFYKVPSDFPGFADASALPNRELRVAKLEECLKQTMSDNRFIPYIQLHEFEALLLADPAKFTSYFLNRESDIKKLEVLALSKQSPEMIDDGETTSPSKQIISILPDYKAAKPVAGPQIAGAIGLDTIREKCPHFAQWLAHLEGLDESGTPSGN